MILLKAMKTINFLFLIKNNKTLIECVRRLRNSDPNTPWEEIAEHLSRYMNTVRVKGYSEQERLNTVKGQ